MGQRYIDEPPTNPKPSAEPDDTPEQLDADIRRDVLRAAEACRERFEESRSHHAYRLSEILEALGRYPHLIEPVHRFMGSKGCPSKVPGIAPILKKGGIDVRRIARKKKADPDAEHGEPILDKDGNPVWQRVPGRPWEGPAMVNVTRGAIAAYDANPLDVAAAVMDKIPPQMKADCRKYAEMDAERVGLAIAGLLDDNLRSAMTANREASRDANPGYGQIVEHAERIDQANENLLDQPPWKKKKIPAKVFRAMLKALGHPKPGNATRGD